jgi:hypothetical protein
MVVNFAHWSPNQRAAKARRPLAKHSLGTLSEELLT